jgi:ATP-dependent helicase/nuclease subunit A
MPTPLRSTELSDFAERETAATTFDRNVVVTAGAGTGKTSLLIDRLVHLLMRTPEVMTEIVALTFTNKAAHEMKLRLRERLESYIAARLDTEPCDEREDRVQRELRSLIERYHLSKENIDRLSIDALRQIERSEIGTIHSFAATLVRLYPMQAGVDPQFVEDDGLQFERAFNEMWTLWLDQQLSYQTARKDEWKNVLRKMTLDEVRGLAFSLCSETVDLQRLRAAAHEARPPVPVLAWLHCLKERAFSLSQQHAEERNNERLVRAALAILEGFLNSSGLAEGELKDERDFLLSGRGIHRNLKGWADGEVEEAQEILRVAKRLCQVDDSLSRSLCDLLVPFAEQFRQAFTRAGTISFDGLLVRARDLLRDHPRVREELKRRFKAILIDEFQDTDPIQYEILIYLAEELGCQAREWREVTLTPGKIFVVGDPKQSIYAFRRADIEAYLEVVEKIIKAQNGIECRLTTNFRSHGAILDAVNGIFGRLIQAAQGLQPDYIPIRPFPSASEENIDQNSLLFRKVTLRKVQGSGEKLNSELARRLEAESLARWLDEEVFGKARILDKEGKAAFAQLKDVAILFRKLTDVHRYLEPLRRRGLRYIVEGEKHFYTVQEIIDAVNLLRAVENPYDRLALVGVLRSPLGGLKDAEIYELHQQGLLDYRAAERVRQCRKKSGAAVIQLYSALHKLHQETKPLPVGEAVNHIFNSVPIRLLAAHSFHGEQAVANLEKLRHQADRMGREGLSTLKEVIARLESRVLELREESESALAEENLDAIRILSIHKAKGLEFPVVILAGCHMTPNPGADGLPALFHDWSTNLVGLRTGSYWSLPGIYLAERAQRREEEEQKRVLYVAMTRAREHLMLSCAPTEWRTEKSFLSMLEAALNRDITALEKSCLIPVGSGAIDVQAIRENPSPPGRSRAEKGEARPQIDWKSYARLWQRRAEERDAALKTPIFLSPTSLKQREAELTERLDERKKLGVSDLSLLIGELAHRFLQDWDFTADPQSFRDSLKPFLQKWLQPEFDSHPASLERELEKICVAFFSSEIYQELCSSRILGREIPLLLPWNGQIMEGVIDLLYEREGHLYLADYKTDRIEKKNLSRVAQKNYRHQVQIYSRAARESLRQEVAGFKLIFLRLGAAIELKPD